MQHWPTGSPHGMLAVRRAHGYPGTIGGRHRRSTGSWRVAHDRQLRAGYGRACRRGRAPGRRMTRCGRRPAQHVAGAASQGSADGAHRCPDGPVGRSRRGQSATRDGPVRPVNSQPAPGAGTALPSLVALGHDRPAVSGTAFVAPGPCSSDGSPSARKRACGTGPCSAPTMKPLWSASAATCRTGASCTQIPACRCQWAHRSPSATTRRCTDASWRIWSSSGWARSCSTGAYVGRHSIIAVGTVLAEGQQVPEGVLVAGVPGKVRRDLSEEERAAIERNAATYIALSQLHRRGGA